MIITIARECGSSGFEIGQKLAEKFGIEFYDKTKLVEEMKKRGNYNEHRDFFEETPMNSFLYGIAMGNGDSTIQTRTFDMIREMVQGKDFVMIGRCSNYIFRNLPDTTRVFIHADREKRIEKVKNAEGYSKLKAKAYVEKTDEKRAAFHEYCTEEKWGEAKHYDLCLNAGVTGVENAVEIIAAFIQRRTY